MKDEQLRSILVESLTVALVKNLRDLGHRHCVICGYPLTTAGQLEGINKIVKDIMDKVQEVKP
jgi:hypothetical protein